MLEAGRSDAVLPTVNEGAVYAARVTTWQHNSMQQQQQQQKLLLNHGS